MDFRWGIPAWLFGFLQACLWPSGSWGRSGALGMRAQGPPVTTNRNLHTRGGCGAAVGLASPFLPECLFICGCGSARGWPGSAWEFMSSQHKTNNIRPSCRHLRGSWVGNGSTYLHTPESWWVRRGTPHCTSQHSGDGQFMSWYPSTATPMPCAPWFVYPGSLHGRTVSQVGFGVSGGHSVAAAAPEAVQGLGGLHWGSCAGSEGVALVKLCRSCTGEAVQELHRDHGGATLG